MIDEKKLIKDILSIGIVYPTDARLIDLFLEMVNNQPKVGEWTPITEKFPKVETEVIILTDTGCITTAMYEDGTICESKSIWNWFEMDFIEKDGELFIPNSWYEFKHFYPDLNGKIDENVVAWQPLPEPPKFIDTYKAKEGEKDNGMESYRKWEAGSNDRRMP